jgi:uncharacterized membrane protein YphA (DoxX/SURF4 family)
MAILRIAIGLLFLILAQSKFFGTPFLHGGFGLSLKHLLSGGSVYPFMVGPLRAYVLPHATTIAYIIAYGQLLVGLALVIGFAAGIASIFGFIYTLAMFFWSAYPGPHAHPWQYLGATSIYLVLAVCFAALIVGEPEKSWSLRIQFRS